MEFFDTTARGEERYVEPPRSVFKKPPELERDASCKLERGCFGMINMAGADAELQGYVEDEDEEEELEISVDWTCERCTYSNSGDSVICDMCGGNHPVSSYVPKKRNSSSRRRTSTRAASGMEISASDRKKFRPPEPWVCLQCTYESAGLGSEEFMCGMCGMLR